MPRSREVSLGALPPIIQVLDRLDLAGIIDRHCPMRSQPGISHGQAICAMIANRLTAKTPLYKVEEWAREWAVEEMLGVPAEALNDDRLGRALEAFAEHSASIVGSFGATAITRYGLDTSQIQWDMTSISVWGVYENPDDGYARPRHGRAKDGRHDLRQVQTGLAVLADGAVPVYSVPLDGGAAEVSQVIGTYDHLLALTGGKPFLLVGDRKLVSFTNLAAMTASPGTRFVAPAPASIVPAARYQDLDPATAAVSDYVPARDAHRLFHQRDVHRVVEGEPTVLRGPGRNDPPLTVRTVFVHSARTAEAAARSRGERITKAREALVTLRRNLGKRNYRTEQAVADRVGRIREQYHVGGWLRAHLSTDPDTGAPGLLWHFDEQAVAASAATDGWMALLTNLTVAEADATGVLRRYKAQEAVERRHSTFKGPLGVAPLFLKNNKRIHALVQVICLALAVYCLIERQARRAAETRFADGKIPGLRDGRPTRPTGRLVLETLAGLRLVRAQDGQPAGMPAPTRIQQLILDLLDADPTKPP